MQSVSPCMSYTATDSMLLLLNVLFFWTIYTFLTITKKNMCDWMQIIDYYQVLPFIYEIYEIPWDSFLTSRQLLSWSNKTPRLSWNTKVFYRVQKGTIQDPILSQLNPIHNLKSISFRSNFNINLPPTPTYKFSSLQVTGQNFVRMSSTLYEWDLVKNLRG